MVTSIQETFKMIRKLEKVEKIIKIDFSCFWYLIKTGKFFWAENGTLYEGDFIDG